MNCAWCGVPLGHRWEVFTDALPTGGGGTQDPDNRIAARLVFVCYEACTPQAPIPDRIVCAGRALDDQGQADGDPCGRAWHKQCAACQNGDVEAHGRGLVQMARASGWRLGPRRLDGTHDAICPRCARPDPTLVKLCNQLTVAGRHG